MSRRKRKEWKRVPPHVLEFKLKDGTVIYYKKNVSGFIALRYHGEWWFPASQWLKIHHNIELPAKLKTLLNLDYVLDKYELKQ